MCDCEKPNPCGCHSDYEMKPVNSPCNCCPAGYVYIGPNTQYPAGACQTIVAPFVQAATIPCNTCEDSITSDCVTISCPATPSSNNATGKPSCFTGCYGILPGDTLTEALLKIDSYCPTGPSAMNNWFYEVANTPALSALFCQLVAACSGGVLTGTIPVITFITIL